MLGQGGPGYTLPAEFNSQFIHKKGALAAARQGDQVNPEKRSSGSQFYIVHGRKIDDRMLESMEKRRGETYTDAQKEIYRSIGGTPHLDGSYTVFGEVVEGLSVLDSIASVQTDGRDRPVEDVWMTMKIKKMKWR
jgi:peptidyl-prolyl cis-trans isomerase B (cyclophilin B)